MTEIGGYSLVFALALAAFATGAALAGRHRPEGVMALSAKRALTAVFVLVTVATASLEILMLRGDFSVAYVASYSNAALPLFYKAAALWAGQAGSLLFWTWLLTLFSWIAVRTRSDEARALLPAAMVVLAGTTFFFLVLNVFAANPFTRLALTAGDGVLHPFQPQDGQGLNPLLQHPAMVIHPPMLYLGYVGFAVPFAFAMAALYYRRSGALWVRIIRRWTLLAWFFLGSGILLGARWAYVELGWGGYWAWDPVENASLMPWLTATAFIHSSIAQQRRGMLKGWNMSLIALTYLLCIFGTFMTRSGIVQSVHAFAQSGIGHYFATFLGVAAVLTTALLLARRDQLRPDHQIEAVLSREAGFLFNNFLLLVSMAAVFIGTLFPAMSEAVRGTQISVGIPFFNKVQVPLGLLLLLLTGAGPLLAYRRTSLASLRRTLLRPWLLSVAVGVALAVAGMRHVYALLAFVLAVFVTITVVEEFARAVRARRRHGRESLPQALLALFERNRARYGGYVVHFGIAVLFCGFAGQAFSTHGTLTLDEGERGRFGRYDLTLERLEEGRTPNYEFSRGTVSVTRDGRALARLTPERRFYLASEQPSTEVAIHSSLSRDIYLVLAGYEEGTAGVVFQVYHNPLVAWVWIGSLVLTLGTIICVLPDRRRAAVLAAAQDAA